jgi:hypothetical protein
LLFLLLRAAAAQGQDFTYTNTNSSITITGYTGPGGAVTIPSTIAGVPVTSISDNAFIGVAVLTGITIPDSVTNLGEQAFFGCSSLASLSIGTGITSINGGAKQLQAFGVFENCTRLTRVTIPDNVTNIGDGPGAIGGAQGAFFNCASLTNVTVGKRLAYLGEGTFSYCSNLVAIYFQGNAPTHGYDIIGEDIFTHDSATVYYLPETTGWGATYATLPTALWNPKAQTNDGGFGVRMNRFGFNITGTAGIPLVIEASTNLAARSWVPLQSCTLTNGLIYFSDAEWTNYPSRVYRFRSP